MTGNTALTLENRSLPGFDRQTLAIIGGGLLLVVVVAFFMVAERARQTDDRVAIVGGGFIYNYGIGEVRYDVAVKLVRPMPIGTRIEAAFENPAGGAPFVVSRAPGTDARRIGLESPAVSGIEKGRDYKVEVRVLDRETNAVIERHELSYRATVDAALVPEPPLTVGPGYHRNPAAPGQ